MRKYSTDEERLESRRSQRRAYYQRHKEYVKEYNKRYYRENFDSIKPKAAIRARATHLRKTYGLSVDEYEAMLESQRGHCFICGPNIKQPRKAHLCVDHDHSTGEIRRLLCDRCNRIIGMADENPSILRSAAYYLMDYQRGEDRDAA